MPLPERTCLIRSWLFPTGGSTGSRPGLRFRYLRVGGSLPMGHCSARCRAAAFLPRPIRNRFELDAALARDAPRRRQPLQAVHRRPHHVVRIGRAEALGQDVADAGALEHGAHRTAGDHARSRRGRLEQHAAGAMTPHDFVRDRATGERDLVHAAARSLDRLAHRFAHFVGLAGRDSDLTFPIPHSHQCIKGEAATPLYDFRDAVDRDDVLDHAVAFAALTAIAAGPIAALTTTPASAAATAPTALATR